MRYALYFAPKRSTALAQLGARWLGRDAYASESQAQPEIAGIDANLFAKITAEPARYGFHATLKPPFRLADGATEEKLLRAIHCFVTQASPVLLERLVLKRIGRFLALALLNPAPLLDKFAAAVVESFDTFRAPPSQQEIARRKLNGLTPAQEAQLARWGYPYVMEQFRFHMTLTGAYDEAILDRVEPAAKVFFREVVEGPVPLDTLTLFVEPEPGMPFRIEGQWPLMGKADEESSAVRISAQAERSE